MEPRELLHLPTVYRVYFPKPLGGPLGKRKKCLKKTKNSLKTSKPMEKPFFSRFVDNLIQHSSIARDSSRSCSSPPSQNSMLHSNSICIPPAYLSFSCNGATPPLRWSHSCSGVYHPCPHPPAADSFLCLADHQATPLTAQSSTRITCTRPTSWASRVLQPSEEFRLVSNRESSSCCMAQAAAAKLPCSTS